MSSEKTDLDKVKRRLNSLQSGLDGDLPEEPMRATVERDYRNKHAVRRLGRMVQADDEDEI
jgi:hypothetical protein